MISKRFLYAASLCLTLGAMPAPSHAELTGVSCNFTQICNNYLACEDITYALSVTATQDGWAFVDEDGERPAIRLPEPQDGTGIPAFASEATGDSTMLLTLYSGGPAMLVEHFEEPGFWSYRGSCDVIQ